MLRMMMGNEEIKVERYELISKTFSFIFKTRFLGIVSLFGLVVFFASMWNRYIYIDDAFFGEQAYYLAKEGVVKIPCLVNFLGCDIQLFSYHKLNIFVGAGLIKLFGWSIIPLRSVTVLFMGALFYVTWLYFKNIKPDSSNKHFVIAAFVLFVNPLILLYGYTFRPEIWVTFFGFSSFLLIDNFIRTKSHIAMVALSGVCAGLAFLTHLNGLIFPVAGFILLIVYRKYREVLIFSVVTVIVSAFYFWDLWQPGHVQTWMCQLTNWPDNNTTNYTSIGIVGLLKNVALKLLSEHQRFFWSYKVWSVSLLFFTALIFNFRFFLKEFRSLLIYTLTLIIVLNVAGSQIAERYLIYLLPFMAIIISIGIHRLFEKWRSGLGVIYLLLVIAHISFFAVMAIDIFKRNDNYQLKHEAVFSRIPDRTQKILVPYQFVFDGLDNYNLAVYKGFEYHESAIGRKLTQQEFFSRADSLGIRYIVFPKDDLNNEKTSLSCIDGKEIEPSLFYTFFYQDSNALILEHIKDGR